MDMTIGDFKIVLADLYLENMGLKRALDKLTQEIVKLNQEIEKLKPEKKGKD